jgi:hypothetical protein
MFLQKEYPLSKNNRVRCFASTEKTATIRSDQSNYGCVQLTLFTSLQTVHDAHTDPAKAYPENAQLRDQFAYRKAYMVSLVTTAVAYDGWVQLAAVRC